jgi:prolyl-tRNA synthetase
VTIRCLPDQQSGSVGQCILTGAPAIIDAVFARAY